MSCIKDDDDQFILFYSQDDPVYPNPKRVPADSIRTFQFFQEKNGVFKMAEFFQFLVYCYPVFFGNLPESLLGRMGEREGKNIIRLPVFVLFRRNCMFFRFCILLRPALFVTILPE